MRAFVYVFQYKDHLGNVRLSYTDVDGSGAIDATNEIIEESNYYPFGLKHKGYNNVITGGNSLAQNWKFGGKEFNEELGLDWYDFGARSYDPAIARWTSIDPVTHFNMSTYMAFDNNPVYFADPSGTTTVSSITDAWNATPENGSSTWNSNGEGGFCDDCPQEGESRAQKVSHINPLDGMKSYTYENQIYHSGGVGGLSEGWTSEDKYYQAFSSIINDIGLGQASIEVLGKYNFTDDVLLNMVSWASNAIDYYNTPHPKASGAITAMHFDSPFFLPGVGLKLLSASRTSRYAFWSGRGTESAAINAGYKVLGQTRAGGNMINLTAGMNRSQSGPFWDRLSAALARTHKPGSTVNVFLSNFSRNNAASTWNRIEKPILQANRVKIKYNYID